MKNKYFNLRKFLKQLNSSDYGMIITERKPRMKLEQNEIRITLTRKEAANLVCLLEYATKGDTVRVLSPDGGAYYRVLSKEEQILAGNIIDGIEVR